MELFNNIDRERMRQATEIMDGKYPMFCVCGKLATGFHTERCGRWLKERGRIYRKLLTQTCDKEG